MALKYKAGDRVRIKDIDWYNNNKNNKGVIVCGSESFTHPMSYFCDKVVTIVTIQDDCYRILEDDGDWYWTDEMIEGLAEEENKPEPKFKIGEVVYVIEYDTNLQIQNRIYKNGIWNYIINIESAPFIFYDNELKKKKEYPKTYEECCEIIHSDPKFYVDTHLYSGALGVLYKLLICRDAYWKIAGEEMGLGKPWEPDWKKQDKKYIISVFNDTVIYFENETYNRNAVLSFPTEEMRDAFYENFKELIEMCKELL